MNDSGGSPRSWNRHAATSLAIAVAFAHPAAWGQALRRIDLAKGATVDAYYEVNVDGKIYVQIAAKPRDNNCAKFWWIKWPFGNVQALGRQCGFATFEIPGFTSLAISAKLRAGGAVNDVKLGVSATEAVAHSATFDF